MAGTGLKKETAAALATLLEKDEFVRFWAFQSIVVYVALFLLNTLLVFSVFLIFATPLVFILGVVLWLMMTYKAWQGERWTVPVIGKFAMQLMKKA
jgi:uncharacterized membrane protein